MDFTIGSSVESHKIERAKCYEGLVRISRKKSTDGVADISAGSLVIFWSILLSISFYYYYYF